MIAANDARILGHAPSRPDEWLSCRRGIFVNRRFQFPINRTFFLLLAFAGATGAVHGASDGAARELDYRIQLDTIQQGFDGNMIWMLPMVGAIPGERPVLILTIQKALLDASDVYFGITMRRSEDLGRTWSEGAEFPNLGRRQDRDGRLTGITALAPQWNAAKGKLLGMGGTSRYLGDQLEPDAPRRPAYTVYDAQRSDWSPWVALEVPGAEKFYLVDTGCCQRLDLPNGEILLPVYFKSQGITAYSTTVMRCSFDGRALKYLGHGDELTLPFDPASIAADLPFPRRQFLARQSGLWEPSLTRFKGRFFLTMRHVKDGYVTTGTDGQTFAPPRLWTWDDGSVLEMENTQTHWVTHAEALYLVYTRKGANNAHVFRHRAPVFIAKVDPERLCVVRATERILIPERGAPLGHCIGITDVGASETWVTTSETMHNVDPKRPADNSVYAARIIWNRPNR